MSDTKVFRLGIIICATIFVTGIIDRVRAGTDNLSISSNYKPFKGVKLYSVEEVEKTSIRIT